MSCSHVDLIFVLPFMACDMWQAPDCLSPGQHSAEILMESIMNQTIFKMTYIFFNQLIFLWILSCNLSTSGVTQCWKSIYRRKLVPGIVTVSGVICSRYDVMMTKNSINVSYNYKEYHRKNLSDTRIHMAPHAAPGSTLLCLVIVSTVWSWILDFNWPTWDR